MIREVRKTDLSREELDSLRKIAKAESRGLPAPATGHETARKLRTLGLISHKSRGLSDKPSKLDEYNATRRGRRLLKGGVV
jgi:hypothetical protein